MSSQVRLKLLPSSRCLFDEPVQVKVAGLTSRQVVTMRARATDEKGVVFSSSATYRADGSGEVDLLRDPSLGGSYSGVEPMGLLWSMKAETGKHKYFLKRKALIPHVVKFSVHEAEGEAEVEGEGRMLAEATNERHLMGEGVSRLPVKEGNVQGVLFVPSGEGLFPAVLDLSTLMSEKRASLLANKGFVVLAVTVYTDEPDNVKEIHLDRFKEAVDFLQQLPKVGSKAVGVISRSKAGDIALSLAAYAPGVGAVVWVNGCNANVAVPLYYKKRQILSSLEFDPSQVIRTESGAYVIKKGLPDPLLEEHKGSLVPVERTTAPLLLMAAEDDLNWDSRTYMEGIAERMRHHGKDNFECVYYPRAGHLMEPPYGPHCQVAPHGLLNYEVLWGGEGGAHAAAEVHMWKMIQEFFKTHLSCDALNAK